MELKVLIKLVWGEGKKGKKKFQIFFLLLYAIIQKKVNDCNNWTNFFNHNYRMPLFEMLFVVFVLFENWITIFFGGSKIKINYFFLATTTGSSRTLLPFIPLQFN